METDKSDPAFPNDLNNYFRGMSLRDWFAGMAMQGFIAGGKTFDPHTNESTAIRSYQIADAMLKAKANGNP